MRTMKTAAGVILASAVVLLWVGLAKAGDNIEVAAQVGDAATVKKLLAANPSLVNARLKTSIFEETLLLTAASSASKGSKEVVEVLLAYGADVNAKDKKNENTPLLMAASKDFTESKDVIKVLLAHGADVNARNKYGYTPLHYAAGHGDKGMMATLLANKANINARTKDGKTPLGVVLSVDNDDPDPEVAALFRQVSAEAAAFLRQHGGTE